MKSYLAIIIGGSAGCLIRWLLGARLNSLFPDLPPGTLVVNLAGGFIIGASLAWFMRHPDLDPITCYHRAVRWADHVFHVFPGNILTAAVR